MKKIILLFSFLFSCSFLFSQPSSPLFVTSDIDNFWSAYDKIVATKDSATQYHYINQLYIDKGSVGLRYIMEARRYTAKSYIDAINSYPLFWKSIRTNTYQAKSYAARIATGVEKFRQLYPAMRPAAVYFTIGAFRSPGTTIDSAVLIGAELAMADETIETSEFPAAMDYVKTYFATNPVKGIVFLNVHEFVHTQQKEHEYILLYRSIYEGIAEFVAATATGEVSSTPAIAYGNKNSKKVKEKFAAEMFSPFTLDNWLYNNTDNEFNTRDMGYYVGYTMAEKYYRQSANKQQAIKEMIELDYANDKAVATYVNATGYFSTPLEKLKKAYESKRPVVAAIKEFKNGAADVSPALTQITIQFSTRMDTRYRNFEIGPLGEANLLRLKRFISFAADGTSVSFEIELQPGRRYQLEVGAGFRTTSGISLRPYLIDFTTASQ